MSLVETLTGVFILVMLVVFFVKLNNLLHVGEWYEGKYIIVGFVVSTVSFMFVLVNVLHEAATSVEYVTYLWIMGMLFAVTFIFTVAEGLLKFMSLHPNTSNERLTTIDSTFGRK